MVNDIKPRKQAQIQKFLKAIDSLLSGSPKKKGKMDTMALNNKNVEIESGLYLKHYPEVKAFIKAKKAAPTVEWSDDGVFKSPKTGQVITKSDLEKTKLESDNHRLKENLESEQKLSLMYRTQNVALTESLEKQLAKHHEMMFVFFDNIPDTKKEAVIKKFENSVTLIDFGIKRV